MTPWPARKAVSAHSAFISVACAAGSTCRAALDAFLIPLALGRVQLVRGLSMALKWCWGKHAPALLLPGGAAGSCVSQPLSCVACDPPKRLKALANLTHALHAASGPCSEAGIAVRAVHERGR